ncbi:MAG: hypothetical protein ACOY31_10625 [Bacillota bacterium]
MKNFEVKAGAGKHEVVLYAVVTSKGIMSVLVGGEEPHLGALVLTVPRPSLSNPGVNSCTSSVLPLIGHKDDEAARPLAEMLARETGSPVSVSAGLHIKGAGPEDIETLKQNCIECGKKLLELIRG